MLMKIVDKRKGTRVRFADLAIGDAFLRRTDGSMVFRKSDSGNSRSEINMNEFNEEPNDIVIPVKGEFHIIN